MVIVPESRTFYRFCVAQMGKEWHEAEICRRSTSGRSGVVDDWSLESTSYRDTARENFLSTFFSASIFRSPFSSSLYLLLHSRLSLLYHLSTCASLRVEFLSYAKSNKLPVQHSSPTKIYCLYPSKSVYGRHGTTGRSGKPLTSLCPFLSPPLFLPLFAPRVLSSPSPFSSSIALALLSRYSTLTLTALLFADYRIADSFNLNTFMIGSGLVGAGLSWWQAWLVRSLSLSSFLLSSSSLLTSGREQQCVIVGYSLAAGFLILTAIPGAKYSIIFPAYVRSCKSTDILSV